MDEKLKRPENKLIYLSFKPIFRIFRRKEKTSKIKFNRRKIIVQKTKQLLEKEKKENNLRYKKWKEFDEKIPLNMRFYASCHIPYSTSFLGGIITQENIKTTGKYSNKLIT